MNESDTIIQSRARYSTTVNEMWHK